LRLVEFRDDAHAAFEIAGAGVGQREPAGRAHQKLRLKPVLKFLHALGDDGFRNAKPARGGDEAAAFDDANEHADPGEFVHGDCSRCRNDPFLYWPIINFFGLI